MNVITRAGENAPVETERVVFPDKTYKLAAGVILLIVNADPLNTLPGRGKKSGDADRMTAVAAQENRGIQDDAMFYDAKGDLDALPEGGNFLLVLRADYKESHKGTHTHIKEITGTLICRRCGIRYPYFSPESHSRLARQRD